MAPFGNSLESSSKKEKAATSVFFSGQNAFRRPTKAFAASQSPFVDTGDFRPFPKTQRPATIRDDVVSSSVSALLGSVSPTTITWFVIAVIVDSFDGVVFARTFAHVGKKHGEIGPSLANRDAAATIRREVFVTGIKASIFHASPSRVLGSFAAFAGVAMFFHVVIISKYRHYGY